ncbi:MAG: phage Gp37/Gp68 family protein [Puniceicoccales bacterium]|jgi:protein gp37|nr:phage Gp37/Gp68 family protein [Puniceicoccales bacterium]
MVIHWNPWHGCHKMSEGCLNCYVYFLDRRYGRDTSVVTRSKTGFNLPIAKNRLKEYKIPSGTIISVCLNSDFFIGDADPWRDEAWKIMEERCDCYFFIITKRVLRIPLTLPKNWGNGYPNVEIDVTTENQRAADQRLPIFIDTPVSYRGIIVSPVLEVIALERFLATGKIAAVSASGESYSGARITNFDDILTIRKQCIDHNVSFTFHQTGRYLLKDSKIFSVARAMERKLASQFGLDFVAKQ